MYSLIRENLTLFDIATKTVFSIDDEKTVQDAIDIMEKNSIRDIIVVDQKNSKFSLLTITEIIKQYLSIKNTTKLKYLKLNSCYSESKDFLVKNILLKFGIDFSYILLVENKKLTGIVSKSDIIANYDPLFLASYEKISNLIRWQKINFVPHDIFVKDCLSLLEDDLDEAIIINKNGKSIGIITTMDILDIFSEDLSLEVPVEKYMSTPIQTIDENATIQEAFEFLNDTKFKRIIIANEKGNITGIVTQSELAMLLHNKWMEITKKNIAKIVELEKIALHDPLTHAYNRAKFQKDIDIENNRIERDNIPFYSIIMIDIDDFKFINDNYGHDQGDIVLKEIVLMMQKYLRPYDTLYRWGGEEFVILLPQTSYKDALQVAEKLRKLVSLLCFNMPKRITCSFGVSSKKSAKEDIDLILKRADEALYQAKQNGKNAVKGKI